MLFIAEVWFSKGFLQPLGGGPLVGVCEDILSIVLYSSQALNLVLRPPPRRCLTLPRRAAQPLCVGRNTATPFLPSTKKTRIGTRVSSHRFSDYMSAPPRPLRRVFVVGVGMTKFEKPGSRDWDYPDMVKEAGEAALADARINYKDIQQVVAGWVYGDSTAGQRAVYVHACNLAIPLTSFQVHSRAVRRPYIQRQQQLLHWQQCSFSFSSTRCRRRCRLCSSRGVRKDGKRVPRRQVQRPRKPNTQLVFFPI
jgi:hypothetical protein